MEVPTEHLHEHIHHEADHEHKGLPMQVALSSAVVAVVAAISALLAGHHANEAMIEQMQVTDQWSFYQAKSIKLTVVTSMNELLRNLGKTPPQEDTEKLQTYRKEQAEIEEQARERERSSQQHLVTYKRLAHAVTLSQVSIALAAMAVLTRRRVLWLGSLALGLAGAGFLAYGLL